MIAAVVCIDKNFGIGYKGELLVNIPEDMKSFKKITSNGAVIMGRKTWDSLPIKPLPNRTNYTISRNSFSVGENSHVITLEEAIQIIKSTTKEEKVFIIGGGEIYKLLLPYCDTVYATKIYSRYTADTFFTNLDKLRNEWKITEVMEMDDETYSLYDYPIYQFVTYKRRN